MGKEARVVSAVHLTDGPAVVRDWVVMVGEEVVGVREMWMLVNYSMT